METRSISPGTTISVGDSFSALNNPHLKKLEEDIQALEARKDGFDAILSLPRKDCVRRIKREDLFPLDDIHEREFQHQKDLGMIVGVGTALTAAALTIGSALLGAIPMSIASLITPLATFAGCGIPFLYLKAARKWIIPRKLNRAENEAIENLRQKSVSLEKRIGEIRDLQAQITKKIAEQKKTQRESLDVRQDDEFVIIAGIKVPKNVNYAFLESLLIYPNSWPVSSNYGNSRQKKLRVESEDAR